MYICIPYYGIIFQKFRVAELGLLIVALVCVLGFIYHHASVRGSRYLTTIGSKIGNDRMVNDRIKTTWRKQDMQPTGFGVDEMTHLDNSTMHTTDNRVATNISYQVPNIVHYIWFHFRGRRHHTDLALHEYISVLSAHRFLKPDAIYFHTDDAPSGRYWDRLKTIPEFHVKHRTQTTRMSGHAVTSFRFDNQASDLERLKVLQEQGGIYLDLDVIVFRSFDPLRIHNLTLSKVDNNSLCNSVILAQRGHPFLKTWLQSYTKDFQVYSRNYNAFTVRFFKIHGRS